MKGYQYNECLDVTQAAEGIALAIGNANSLLSDAILLYENSRYERALAIAILAIEEAGKPAILRSILLEDDPKEARKSWEDFRKHTSKNVSWLLPEFVEKGARRLDDFREMFIDKTHAYTLDNLKQLAFYTDVFSSCKWSAPSQVVDKDLAQAIISTAKLLVRKDKSKIISAVELDVWVRHLKPVWKQDMRLMKQALVNCYRELEESGLIEQGSAEAMKQFTI